jgi:hypothetical protein
MPGEIQESTYIAKPIIPKRIRLVKKSNARTLTNAKNAI